MDNTGTALQTPCGDSAIPLKREGVAWDFTELLDLKVADEGSHPNASCETESAQHFFIYPSWLYPPASVDVASSLPDKTALHVSMQNDGPQCLEARGGEYIVPCQCLEPCEELIHTQHVGSFQYHQNDRGEGILPHLDYAHPSPQFLAGIAPAACASVPVPTVDSCAPLHNPTVEQCPSQASTNSQPSYTESNAVSPVTTSQEVAVPPPTEVVGPIYQVEYGEPFEVTAPVGSQSPPSRPAKKASKTTSKFQCPACDKKFCSMSARQNHIRSHTRDRPFACDVCNNKFIYKHNLTAHMRTHDPVEKYSCPRCGRTFRHKNDRNIHVLTFACTRWSRHILDSLDTHYCLTCSSDFEDRETLLHHVRQHNKGLPVLCPVCSASFSGLKGHAIVKHVNKSHPYYLASLMLD